jgi:hypothetical protein
MVSSPYLAMCLCVNGMVWNKHVHGGIVRVDEGV